MKEFLIIRDAQKFKEASEPSRQKILQILSIKEMSVDELAKILEKDVSTIYRHINKLEAAGFVEVAREEPVGPVSKRYYRRAAKIIIGLLPPEETFESEIFRKYSYEKIREGLLALRGFRYNIPEDEASLDELTEIAIEWDKLWEGSIDARIDEEKMVGDVSAYYTAALLLALVETREDPRLRRATESLVSELAKHRKNV
jgi:DNA-binding transcriptional ArsR family regulator